MNKITMLNMMRSSCTAEVAISSNMMHSH